MTPINIALLCIAVYVIGAILFLGLGAACEREEIALFAPFWPFALVACILAYILSWIIKIAEKCARR